MHPTIFRRTCFYVLVGQPLPGYLFTGLRCPTSTCVRARERQYNPKDINALNMILSKWVPLNGSLLRVIGTFVYAVCPSYASCANPLMLDASRAVHVHARQVQGPMVIVNATETDNCLFRRLGDW